MTVTITLTAAGLNVGPFDLYSDIPSQWTLFESGVSRAALLAGYTTALAPDYTNSIRIQSTGECTNYIDVTVIPYTTTTSTTLPSTTTTTTTLALTQYCYSGLYPCGDPVHEILGHEPYTGSVTYTDELGVSHTSYYCSDIGVISVYSSSAPITVAMTSETCPTTTTTTTIP